MFKYRDPVKVRHIEIEPTYEELVECNRQYLLAVLREHQELAHMVPEEMLREPKPRKLPEPEPERLEIDIMMPPKPMHEAAEEVAKRHGITVEALIGRNRSPKYTPARSDFVVACREANTSYQKIGIFMGGRDWATIMHYEKKHRYATGEAA